MRKPTQSIIRAGYSPSEFARFFNKHPSWCYRQLYSGKVRAVTSLGRILIPASELDRVMATAKPYNPKLRRRKASKAIAEDVAI